MVDRWHGREGNGRNPQQSFEESDARTVPTCKKSANSWVTPEESMEGKRAANGKLAPRNALRAQDRAGALTAMERVGQRAKQGKGERFTNLLNHLKVPLLKGAYERLNKNAAPGVDGVTWSKYGENLDARLRDLQDRVHRGNYHPQPVRRVYIPKGDGRTRPLGIPALEDKIVQQAARMILEPIYEQEFLGFSYGFRPGRSQHRALDALAVAISRKVSWVLDADIRAFYDTIEHGWMQKFFEHKIADRRMVRLLMKWLHAGVVEQGELRAVEEGAPQGGGISPLMSNVYLHYALDLWVQQWRKRHARGEVYVVRYADDVVLGFQFEQDARAMQSAMAERLAKFGLELHPEKTRVLRFGRYARKDSERDGHTRPETFDFLGFTHIATESRLRRFMLMRRTARKKRAAKMSSLREGMRRRMHEPLKKQHGWLCSVIRGHDNYYGVPTNHRALASFHREVQRCWYRQLQRRDQRSRWPVSKFKHLDARYPLPPPRVVHPWPDRRFAGP
ncbi:group II intron reverse transcriptase/maturase [Sorangium sp. So ce1151]|uniref:group II intron reverse transcriptase/maturase n=1 Tax=Sorangium sp. So ce1151 TaxID=3133332 RepID=UPI003F5F75C3